MGYMRHHAILATSWDIRYLQPIIDSIGDYNFQHNADHEMLIGEDRVNGYVTMVITPDGSKEGWPDSDAGDDFRNEILELLRKSDCIDWCEVQYGDDAGNDYITNASSFHHDEPDEHPFTGIEKDPIESSEIRAITAIDSIKSKSA